LAEAVRVKGLRELLAVTDKLPKHAKREVRDALRSSAEPVRQTAELNFRTTFPGREGASRFGISVRKVGTISVEQRKRRTTGKRLDFAKLQMADVLIPALDSNEREIVNRVDAVLDDLERKWGRP